MVILKIQVMSIKCKKYKNIMFHDNNYLNDKMFYMAFKHIIKHLVMGATDQCHCRLAVT